TCATSSECVSRLRAKSSPAVGLSTCAFAARRRSALECSRRARSRAKSLRREECSSGRARSASKSLYPPNRLAPWSTATGVALPLGQVAALVAVELARLQPFVRQG